MKVCTRCGLIKTLDEFSRNGKRGLHAHCKACGRERTRTWRAENKAHKAEYDAAYRDKNKESRSEAYRRWVSENPEVRKASSRAWWLSQYGLSPAEFAALAEQQGDKCAICGDEVPLHVDHDHETGVVRGLLCTRCNPGLGFFRDDVGLLRRAIRYLESR